MKGPLAPRLLAAARQAEAITSPAGAPPPVAPSPVPAPSASKRKHEAPELQEGRACSFVQRPSTGVKSRAVVIGFASSCKRFLSGFCRVTLLKGSASINGYELRIGTFVPCNFPVWQPAALLEVSALPTLVPKKRREKDKGNKAGGNGNIDSLATQLKSVNVSPHYSFSVESNIGDFCVVLLIEGVGTEDQEWLVAAEDQRLYLESDDGDGETYLRVDSALVGTSGALSSLGIDCTTLSADWRAAADLMVGAQASGDSPRAIVCGAKGVGKSTCLRYLLNRMLGTGTGRAVCVLDTDLGQPEFTVPGMVSLHIVTEPILSPTHLNLRPPLLSFFIGDVTSKHEPDALVKAISTLVTRYRAELHTHVEKQRAERSRLRAEAVAAAEAAASTNAFELLSSPSAGAGGAGNAESENGGGGECGGAPYATALPLLVNADGFVRFMGAELLSALFDMVSPTHVMHLATDKDRNLPAVDRERQRAHQYSQALVLAEAQQVSDGNGNENESVDAAFGSSLLPPPAASVLELAPGRLTASKIAPTDLRVLRLVSYFLRESQYLRSRAYLHLPGGVVSERVGGLVQVRTGSLSDRGGALAYAIMEACSYMVPLQSVFLQILHADLSPRLVLAAMNASVVAINTSAEPPPHSVVQLATEKDEPLSVQVCSSHEIAAHGSAEELSPCLGLGIVRAVDAPGEQLTLITPLDPNTFPRGHAVRLVRGNISLPSTFVYAPNLASFPYLSGESAGDAVGGTLKHSRSNIKRRSHAKPN